MTPDAPPSPGDIVWIDLDPVLGHEQRGRRPAVVLSAQSYNRRTGLAVCCPITTRVKGFVFEVALGGAPASVVLADQVRCIDWRRRNLTKKGRASSAELAEVRDKLAALIGIS